MCSISLWDVVPLNRYCFFFLQKQQYISSYGVTFAPHTSYISPVTSYMLLILSGHTVTIRVLLLKRQEHHLNALTGKKFLSGFLFSFHTIFFLNNNTPHSTYLLLLTTYLSHLTSYLSPLTLSLQKTHPAGN